MTETQTGDLPADDIDDAADGVSARLGQEADAILMEGRTFARPLHEAVRQDAVAAREWGGRRVERLRRAVEDEPVRATLYALGVGVLIGLLAAR